jgi:hypothetical protein
MAELPGARTKNTSNGNHKNERRSLLFAFDAVALNSSLQYKN